MILLGDHSDHHLGLQNHILDFKTKPIYFTKPINSKGRYQVNQFVFTKVPYGFLYKAFMGVSNNELGTN